MRRGFIRGNHRLDRMLNRPGMRERIAVINAQQGKGDKDSADVEEFSQDGKPPSSESHKSS